MLLERVWPLEEVRGNIAPFVIGKFIVKAVMGNIFKAPVVVVGIAYSKHNPLAGRGRNGGIKLVGYPTILHLTYIFPSGVLISNHKPSGLYIRLNIEFISS